MAGTQFSPDRSRAGPGRKVGSGPGPMQRRSDRDRQQAQRQVARSRKGQAPAGAPPAQQARLGHPWAGAEPEQEPTGDYRHVQLLAQHQNIQGLGRESPFGIHASLTGEYRQLFGDPDKVPFDVLEDGS